VPFGAWRLNFRVRGISSILRTRCNLRETPWKRAKGSTKNIKDGGAAILRRRARNSTRFGFRPASRHVVLYRVPSPIRRKRGLRTPPSRPIHCAGQRSTGGVSHQPRCSACPTRAPCPTGRSRLSAELIGDRGILQRLRRSRTSLLILSNRYGWSRSKRALTEVKPASLPMLSDTCARFVIPLKLAPFASALNL
jgi:hypothetical protein